jgi:hypothetical protein
MDEDLFYREKVSKAPMQQLETPAVAAEEGMLLFITYINTKMLVLQSIQYKCS